jgi:predicted SAM-dependent methyltransferase
MSPDNECEPGSGRRLLEKGEFVKKVDIGCGKYKLPGYIGIDQEGLEGVDYVMDVRSGLPFAKGEVDEIYTGHFLEHLTGPECLELLKECYRVLKPSGIMEIMVPDFIWCCQEFLREPEEERWKYPAARIFGLQDSPWEYHRNGFSRERLAAIIQDAGFTLHGIVPIWSHTQRCLLAKATKDAA